MTARPGCSVMSAYMGHDRRFGTVITNAEKVLKLAEKKGSFDPGTSSPEAFQFNVPPPWLLTVSAWVWEDPPSTKVKVRADGPRTITGTTHWRSWS